jgi:alpha-L-rhamnosidase
MRKIEGQRSDRTEKIARQERGQPCPRVLEEWTHGFADKAVGAPDARQGNWKFWLCPFLQASVLSLLFLGAGCSETNGSQTDLEQGWAQPPLSARTRAYWWWLNGNVTSNAITRDLEEMKSKGWGGALICDAGGASQNGNDNVPHGPTFFSSEWRALFKHALHEADRLGLEMSLNIQSGWNLGGPMVKADDAVKKLTWSETQVTGAKRVSIKLPAPPANDNFYRDVSVLAWRVKPGLSASRPPLKNLEVKALRAKPTISGPDGWFIANSAPPTDPVLFEEEPSTPGEEDTHTTDVLDLTRQLAPDGTLTWDAPPGTWLIVRFGCTLGDLRRVSTQSDGWDGYAIDVLDEGALARYWDAVVEPLLADAGPFAGKTLKYLHTDSWEIGVFNWTPTLPAEFRRRCGYDLLPWLPVIAGRIINSREESDRFLHDFRKTLGELAIDNHYKPFQQRATKHGLEIHPESGGPHFVPVDAQRALGLDDVPMSEFWAESTTHRRTEVTRFFVKQPASAAHTYGKKLVAAEGFTAVGPHWQETIWDNLKPSFDHACTEGLNRLFWHAFVCSPKEMGMPGQQYFAGTHMNPNVTWWSKSGPFISYLNRCQFMLQQGLFVADALYYYGDHVPNFAQLRRSDPAHVGAGYDYDVITEDAILTRLGVKDGKLVLPDGMTYRVLVLPDREIISLPVLMKVQQLLVEGATVIMPRPQKASGLAGFPAADGQVQQIADQLLGETKSAGPMERKVGIGRVIRGKTAREVLLADGVKPDFECTRNASASSSTLDPQRSTDLDYIHRRDGDAEIYFIASRAKTAKSIQATFRISGKAPELWDAVSGERRFADSYSEANGRTTLPLDLPPAGSVFVVFREPASGHPAKGDSNSPRFTAIQERTGPWTVSFDPKWGGPASVQFDKLVSWTERTEPGIKFYSGTAVYRKIFEMPDATRNTQHVFLDLGDVRELAEVKLNGQSCGITWSPPFRVDISRALKSGSNELEIEVVNFWPNRIIGDDSLPSDQRLTRTNVRKLTKNTPLMRSGLFGPVRLATTAE